MERCLVEQSVLERLVDQLMEPLREDLLEGQRVYFFLIYDQT